MRADSPEYRLAVYGSLRPGQPNHARLQKIEGCWLQGWVEGVLHPEGWGMTHGFPALVPERGAERVRVDVLESRDLPVHWDELDDFEGEEYQRVAVPVHLASGMTVTGYLYALRGRR